MKLILILLYCSITIVIQAQSFEEFITNGKPQTYRSQITTDNKTGKKIVYQVQKPEKVNQRRKEIGLSSIESYVKQWGIEWTIKQK